MTKPKEGLKKGLKLGGKSRVIVVKGKNPLKMVEEGLSYFSCPSKEIVLKPNLINHQPPPTTTPVKTVEAVAKYFLESNFEVSIAEGSGWSDTPYAFKKLGYQGLAERHGVKLIDLNRDTYIKKKNEASIVLKEFWIPSSLKNKYLISIPVLKEHSITTVTLSMKNMLGAAPPNKNIVARKGDLHRIGINESIVDINLYLKPNLAIIDGIEAGLGGELNSKPKKTNVMIFSDDLVAADSAGAKFLGYDPMKIRHIRLAMEKGLGSLKYEEVEV